MCVLLGDPSHGRLDAVSGLAVMSVDPLESALSPELHSPSHSQLSFPRSRVTLAIGTYRPPQYL